MEKESLGGYLIDQGNISLIFLLINSCNPYLNLHSFVNPFIMKGGDNVVPIQDAKILKNHTFRENRSKDPMWLSIKNFEDSDNYYNARVRT